MSFKRRVLVVATQNRNKLKEISPLLKGLRVRLISLSRYPDYPEVVENADTLEGNAVKKAFFAAQWTGRPAMADDSGLFVKSLGGRPGVLSARFAGPKATTQGNNRKLLKLLKGKTVKNRRAEFCCVIALAAPSGKIRTVKGTCRGYIASESKGKKGFGYDPVFVVPRYRKTFAELPSELKNRISHRARALQKIRRVIREFL